jgi:hypothetical protein
MTCSLWCPRVAGRCPPHPTQLCLLVVQGKGVKVPPNASIMCGIWKLRVEMWCILCPRLAPRTTHRSVQCWKY